MQMIERVEFGARTPATSAGHRGRRGGFTLVELLVVVAVIAVLIAMLLPALAKARERAVCTVCLANIRQTNLGVQYYAEEYLLIVPSYGWVFPGDQGVVFNPSTVADVQFFPNTKAIRCPKNAPTPNNARNAYAQIWPVTYPAAPELINGVDPYHDYVNTKKIQRTANYVMLIDSVQLGSGPPSGGNYKLIPPGGPVAVWCFNPSLPRSGAGSITLGKVWDSGNWPGLWLAHENKANAAFADGHAETLALSAIYRIDNGKLNNTLCGTSPNPKGSYGAGAFWHSDGVAGPLYPNEQQ